MGKGGGRRVKDKGKRVKKEDEEGGWRRRVGSNAGGKGRKSTRIRGRHKETPKKKLIEFIHNDYKDTSLFLGDWDYKFMGDILDDEDKAIDYLSKKRERENDDDLVDNKVFQNYSKKYGSNNEYSNKINNKNNEGENEEGKNEDIFDFEVNNINQNNDDGDDDEEENKYYHHLLKK